jgi:hypothetical protein
MLVDTLIDNGVHPKHGVFDQQKSGFHQGFSVGNDQTQLGKPHVSKKQNGFYSMGISGSIALHRPYIW